MFGIKLLLVLSLAVIHGSTSPVLEATPKNTQLEFVFIIHRTGRRAPGSAYPRDPIKESYWEKYQGPNELTAKGMNDNHELGELEREFYKDFLPEKYNKADIVAGSTNNHRSIQSAQLFLTGLYEPVGAQVWDDDFDFMPVPVYENPFTLGSLLSQNKCPKFLEHLSEEKSSKYYQDFLEKNSKFLQVLSKKTGLSPLSLEDASDIADILTSEAQEGLKIPLWSQFYMKEIQKINRFVLDFENGRDMEINKLRSGNILHRVLETMEAHISNQPAPKMMIYSTGDSELGSFISFFKDPEEMLPVLEFGSAFVLELRSDSKGRHYIKAAIKNNPATKEADFDSFMIHGCQEQLCTLKEFNDVVKDKRVEDLEEACMGDK